MKNVREDSVVRVVVCHPGRSGRTEERARVRKVEDGKVYIDGLETPFSRETGICLKTFVKGMLVMLELDSLEPA